MIVKNKELGISEALHLSAVVKGVSIGYIIGLIFVAVHIHTNPTGGPLIAVGVIFASRLGDGIFIFTVADRMTAACGRRIPFMEIRYKGSHGVAEDLENIHLNEIVPALALPYSVIRLGPEGGPYPRCVRYLGLISQ